MHTYAHRLSYGHTAHMCWMCGCCRMWLRDAKWAKVRTELWQLPMPGTNFMWSHEHEICATSYNTHTHKHISPMVAQVKSSLKCATSWYDAGKWTGTRWQGPIMVYNHFFFEMSDRFDLFHLCVFVSTFFSYRQYILQIDSLLWSLTEFWLLWNDFIRREHSLGISYMTIELEGYMRFPEESHACIGCVLMCDAHICLRVQLNKQTITRNEQATVATNHMNTDHSGCLSFARYTTKYMYDTFVYTTTQQRWRLSIMGPFVATECKYTCHLSEWLVTLNRYYD